MNNTSNNDEGLRYCCKECSFKSNEWNDAREHERFSNHVTIDAKNGDLNEQ